MNEWKECKHPDFDWMRIGKAYFINGVKIKECNWCKEDSGCLVDGTLYVPNIYRIVIGLFGPTEDAIKTCVNLAISKIHDSIDQKVSTYLMEEKRSMSVIKDPESGQLFEISESSKRTIQHFTDIVYAQIKR